LRAKLFDIEAEWDEEKCRPCPYTFTQDEREKHARDMARRLMYGFQVGNLQNRLGCSEDGWVAMEDYEKAKSRLEQEKKDWDDESYGGPFPFEDGKWGLYLR
jgi:hypothetical protein